jgi:hypothetical protein
MIDISLSGQFAMGDADGAVEDRKRYGPVEAVNMAVCRNYRNDNKRQVYLH